LAIYIPREDRLLLAEMVRSSATELDQLLAALRDEGPKLKFEVLALAIATKIGRPKTKVEGYLRVLGNISQSSDRSGMGLSQFLTEIEPVITERGGTGGASGLNPITPEQFLAFENFAKEALDLKSSFALSLKAYGLLTESERLYNRARVITDLRNVFLESPDEKPAAAVIVHSLRITFAKRGAAEKEDFYVEMDIQDIDDLKSALDRAALKEKEIRTHFGDKVTILEV